MSKLRERGRYNHPAHHPNKPASAGFLLPMTWINDYIGIPFLEQGRTRAGCDCWGLVRLVLAERWGVELPSYHGDYVGTSRRHCHELATLIDARRPLVGVVPVSKPTAGDIVLMRVGGHLAHVGLVVGPGVMLHTETGIESVCERYDGKVWRYRVDGFYRPAALT